MNVEVQPPAPVDLTNCDREPIHVPGAIQPHGVLFTLTEPALVVQQVSANVRAHLGLAPEELLGQRLGVVLDASSVAAVERALVTAHLREVSPIRVRAVRPDASAPRFDGIVHRSGGLVVLELEPITSTEEVLFSDFYRQVRRTVVQLQRAAAIVPLCQVATDEVRRMTGFDRVMTYRFDRDGHGHVIAEAKRDDLESFLDLHYPASDIPAQARRLYERNWLRTIVDVAYQPAPVVPTLNPLDGTPLDLSDAVLRSVSPIHVEYMRNMGVHASMSISLMRDGALWGLIICHHYAPRFVAYEVRTACEFLGQELSWQVAARERAELADRRAAAQRSVALLVRQMTTRPGLVAGLTDDPRALLELVRATGAAVYLEGVWHGVGQVPPREDLVALGRTIREHLRERKVYATEALSALHPEAAPYAALASGLLAVAVSPQQGDLIMWFRPEIEQTVHWAGDPNKTATLAEGTPRLSPRGSFALWRETLRGHAEPWQPWELEAATDLAHVIRGAVVERAAELARLNRELNAANLAKDEFLAMVSHELRTPLNAMLGWLRMLRLDLLPVDRRAAALETVERNARAQAQLVEDLLDISRIIAGKLRLDVVAVDLAAIVEAAVQTVQPSAEARDIRVQPVLDPQAGPVVGDGARLQQVIWNLLTNAVKFSPRGRRVQVRLQRNGSYAEVTVADEGEGIEPALLPHVFERFRQAEGGAARSHQGLGLGLAIVKHLVELHGGSVQAHSPGKGGGATFVVRLPVASVGSMVSTAPAGHPEPSDSTALDCPPAVAGARVLVVDDELDATALLVALLTHCGARVTAVSSAAAALSSIAVERPDVIVSDIGMPGMDGYAFIRALRALPADQGGYLPAVALTAYARPDDRARAFRAGFQAHVPKPIEANELLAVLSSLLGRPSPPPIAT